MNIGLIILNIYDLTVEDIFYKETYKLTKMDPNQSSESQGADQERKEEFNFGDLAGIMQKMGNLVGTVATDFNNTMTKVSDVFNKIGVSLSDEERDEVDELFVTLSEEERSELLEMVKDKTDSNTMTAWWNKRCDNERLVDIMVSCSDAFGEIFNTTSDIEKGVMDTFGALMKDDNPLENIFGGITGELEKLFSQTGSEPENKGKEKEPEGNETGDENAGNKTGDEDKYAKVFSNLGNCVSDMMQTFNETGDDPSTIRERTIHAFSDLGVDKEYMGECFDIGFEMGQKINEEVVSKVDSNSSDSTPDETSNNSSSNDPTSNNSTSNPDETVQDDWEEAREIFNNMASCFDDIKASFKDLENVEEGEELEVVKEGMKIFLEKMGVSQEEQDKFDKSFDQQIKLQEMVNNFEIEINDSIRQGLIDEAAKMVKKSEQLSDECNTLVGLLNPIELRILQLQTGSLSPNFHVVRLESKIDSLEQKLDRVLNKLDIVSSQETEPSTNYDGRFDSIEERLDDISLDLELIRNKSVQRTVIKH